MDFPHHLVLVMMATMADRVRDIRDHMDIKKVHQEGIMKEGKLVSEAHYKLLVCYFIPSICCF